MDITHPLRGNPRPIGTMHRALRRIFSSLWEKIGCHGDYSKRNPVFASYFHLGCGQCGNLCGSRRLIYGFFKTDSEIRKKFSES